MKLIIILLCCFFIAGCGKDYTNIIKDNLADIREIMYKGETDGLLASLVCGKRESDYKMNGTATTLIPFGIITVEVEGGATDENISYILKFSDLSYDGKLLKNPFEENYMADIGEIIDRDSVVLQITINETVFEINLTRVDTDFKYSADDVMNKIVKEYKSELKSFEKEKIFKAEVYIKIITNENVTGKEKLWYVNIISPFGESFALVISPYTGDTLSVQKNLGNVAS